MDSLHLAVESKGLQLFNPKLKNVIVCLWKTYSSRQASLLCLDGIPYVETVTEVDSTPKIDLFRVERSLNVWL